MLHGVPPGLVGARIRVSRVTARPFSSFVICAGAIVGLLVTPSARAVAQVCGNGVIEGTEACDGLDLGGQTCLTLGFDGGSLVCAGDCNFDTSGCSGIDPIPLPTMNTPRLLLLTLLLGAAVYVRRWSGQRSTIRSD